MSQNYISPRRITCVFLPFCTSMSPGGGKNHGSVSSTRPADSVHDFCVKIVPRKRSKRGKSLS